MLISWQIVICGHYLWTVALWLGVDHTTAISLQSEVAGRIVGRLALNLPEIILARQLDVISTG